MVTVVDVIRERAARQPDHAALVIADARGAADEVVSYAALVREAETLARRLCAGGLRPQERCGLVAAQGRAFVEGALAILMAGACMAPIPDDVRGEALERQRREARLACLLDRREGDVVRRFDDDGVLDGDAEAAFRALDPAYLRFTSGTTSRRKGVVLGHATIMARLDAAQAGLALGPTDRVLWLLPMAHHFVVSVLLYLREGATILVPGSSLARPVLELAARAGASVIYASPFHLSLLAADASGLGLDRLRLAVSTAEGLRADVASRFAARFGQPIVQALGVIEVGLPLLNRASAATKPTSLGRPLPGYSVWLRGENGAPVTASGPTHTGELCLRGPGMLDAYLAPWTPAREVLEPDGFRTGDQAWIDADGDVHLAGRRANRINMAGMKFFAEEVEAVLESHPGVRRARVSARLHPHLGEIPVAEIVPADATAPPAPAELTAFCRERLPAYKIPRSLRAVAELPLTPTGKLVRHALDANEPRGA